MTLPTLSDLNKLSTVQNNLLILRALNTSDLAFHYMLLATATVRDIVNNSIDALEYEKDDVSLTADELAEYMDYIKDLSEYTTSQID